MVTKIIEQIENEHHALTKEIRASHLERQEISHEEYHNQLNAENERHEAELAVLFPPEPPRDYGKELDEIKTKLKQAGIV